MAESQTMIRLCRKEAVCNLGSKLKKSYFREGAIKTRNTSCWYRTAPEASLAGWTGLGTTSLPPHNGLCKPGQQAEMAWLPGHSSLPLLARWPSPGRQGRAGHPGLSGATRGSGPLTGVFPTKATAGKKLTVHQSRAGEHNSSRQSLFLCMRIPAGDADIKEINSIPFQMPSKPPNNYEIQKRGFLTQVTKQCPTSSGSCSYFSSSFRNMLQRIKMVSGYRGSVKRFASETCQSGDRARHEPRQPPWSG